MRTGCSLTVGWGGCSRGDVCSWGVFALEGVSGPSGGMSTPGGCVCSDGGVVSQHALRQTPPTVDRITDTSKNITLATTSLRPVINYFSCKLKRDLTGNSCTNCSFSQTKSAPGRDLATIPWAGTPYRIEFHSIDKNCSETNTPFPLPPKHGFRQSRNYISIVSSQYILFAN